jgi:hypothetical protein
MYILFSTCLDSFKLIENQCSTNHEWISNAPTMEVPREFDVSDQRKSRLKTIRIDNRDQAKNVQFHRYLQKVNSKRVCISH